MNNPDQNIRLFVKVNSFQQIMEDKILLDIEVAALDSSGAAGGLPVALTMNGKSHSMATMANGMLSAELIFPFRPAARQRLSVVMVGNETVKCTWEIIPDDYEVEIEKKAGAAVEEKLLGKIRELEEQLETLSPSDKTQKDLLLEDVLNGKRTIGRGDVLNIPAGFYDVTADMVIERGGKVVIEAGTTLEFGEEAGIICEGVLEAVGLPQRVITFTAIRSRWRNILIYGRHTSGTKMFHCLIEHGTGRSLQKDALRDIWLPVNTMGGKPGEGCGGGLQILYTHKADIVIRGLVVRENDVGKGKGGGVGILDSSPVLLDSEISKNKASLDGGGIYICGPESTDAQLEGVKISGNIAGNDGGGIYLEGVSPGITNAEITCNQAYFGGGIYHHHLHPDDLRLLNCRVFENDSTAAPTGDQEICGNWLS